MGARAADPPIRWGSVLAWSVIGALAVVLLAAVAVPRMAGATPYVVLTGSMRPAMPPGTLVVVKPAPASALGIGDVITYQIRSGDPTVVTHRIVGQGISAAGEPVFRTRGDANGSADAGWVREVQVRGERWYSIPYLGYLTTLMPAGARGWLARGAALALLGYALAQFTGGLRRAPASVARHRWAAR